MLNDAPTQLTNLFSYNLDENSSCSYWSTWCIFCKPPAMLKAH